MPRLCAAVLLLPCATAWTNQSKDGYVNNRTEYVDYVNAYNLSTTLINQYPFLMSHDASTTYTSGGVCSLFHPENDWTITQQQGDFAKQLDCGARALDLRMYMKDGKLEMHHGPITIDKSFDDAMGDVVGWANKHPQELVLLYANHFDGSTDDDKSKVSGATSTSWKSKGIPEIQCSELKGLTVAAATAKAKLPGGGAVLGFKGCTSDDYDSTIKCYVGSNAHLPCYSDPKAFNQLWTYMGKECDTSSPPHESDGQLWMAQAHWQYDAPSVAQGTLHDSCILEDESKAGTNKHVADKIKGGSFKHVNILEVDNVCDGGQDLLAALRGRGNSVQL